MIESLAIFALLPCFVLLVLTVHILYFSESQEFKFRGWVQFWPFYKQMKEKYPASSRFARCLIYVSGALVLPWFITRALGW